MKERNRRLRSADPFHEPVMAHLTLLEADLGHIVLTIVVRYGFDSLIEQDTCGEVRIYGGKRYQIEICIGYERVTATYTLSTVCCQTLSQPQVTISRTLTNAQLTHLPYT